MKYHISYSVLYVSLDNCGYFFMYLIAFDYYRFHYNVRSKFCKHNNGKMMTDQSKNFAVQHIIKYSIFFSFHRDKSVTVSISKI
jgi:hypothetical protein